MSLQFELLLLEQQTMVKEYTLQSMQGASATLAFAWHAAMLWPSDQARYRSASRRVVMQRLETQGRGCVHEHFLLYDGTVVTTTQRSVNEDVVLDDGTEAVLYLSKYLMKKK